MQSYWFGDVGDNGKCAPVTGDARAVATRILSLKTDPGTFTPLRWESAAACGVCRDRAEYVKKLREVCFTLAEDGIRREYAGRDTELLQMVRTLDELDSVINLLAERAIEWHQTRHPSFSRKYHKKPVHVMIRTIRERDRGALGNVASQIEALSDTRTALAKAVSGRAGEVMPNTSALIGGLVAARLAARAGGLGPLSRLPASAIQVIGARTALFSHLRTGSPAPKHGIIFQHRRVHNAPRECRGKVARVLAAKLAIASRLDYYRGSADAAFLGAAQEAIDNAGNGGEAS